MGESHLAWLAGIIDGEGWISILCCNGRNLLVLGVANTDEAIVRRCQEIVNGGSITSRPPQGFGTKVQWIWQINGLAAQKVIGQVMCYLVGMEKRRRADLAMQFPCYPNGSHPLTEKAKDTRRRVYEEIKSGGVES